MNKNILIIALISLSVVLASNCEGEQSNNPDCLCHSSCICEEGSTICKKCRYEELGAVMDQFKKSCPCPPGYYTKSLKPFQCESLLVPDQQQEECEESACERDIKMRMRDISLNTNCYFCYIDGKSYVVSEVSLNLNSVSLAENCKTLLDQKIKYLRPESNSYEELHVRYLEQRVNGAWTIRIPLIDVFNLAMTTNVGSTQIAQQIHMLSLLGMKGKYFKQIRWAICIYTNRDVVEVFQLDVDIQETEQDCVDCIVIADLETVGQVYQDSTFTTKLTAPFTYFVGDYFYAKITFKDSSYTKFLRFVSLYYKNDLGQIFDYSSVTNHSWQNNGLTIALPLSEPSHPATIQVQMKIDDKQGGRFLQESSGAPADDKQKANFSIEVQSNGKDDKPVVEGSNGSMMLFGLINLIAAILLI